MDQNDANYEDLVKKWRKKPLFDVSQLPEQFTWGRREVERILPHRPPLLFVDSIIGVDVDGGLIAGTRTLDPNDPVFAGHFPGTPVYPGNLAVETIGQLGLCLGYFEQHGVVTPAEGTEPRPLRATRILGAQFSLPMEPGAEVVILGKKIYEDPYYSRLIGQTLIDGKVTCTAIGEVMFLD